MTQAQITVAVVKTRLGTGGVASDLTAGPSTLIANLRHGWSSTAVA
jgi:hypothetical protein